MIRQIQSLFVLFLILLIGCGPAAPTEPTAVADGATATATSTSTPQKPMPTIVPTEVPTSTGEPTPATPSLQPVDTATSTIAAPPAPSASTTAEQQPPTTAPATATSEPTAIAAAPVTPVRATATADPTATPQIRALWVDAFHSGFHTPEEVHQLIDDARRGNINTLIVQVRRRGDTFYRSTIEPPAETADEPAPVPTVFDPLQALIDEAHANGIEVHAWIASLPVWHWNTKYQTTNPQHVWHRHGPAASGRENWVMMRLNDDGTLSPTYALDPGHPDAAEYTVNVALELIRNYDIDGLHLDYIRYGSIYEGYNPVAVERFNTHYGRSGQPDPSDADWLQWRRDQVTALVRRLYIESYAIKPQVKISAAVITWGAGPTDEASWTKTAAYASVLQDWRAWTEEGILDLALPMNYYREYISGERSAYDQWIAWAKDHQYGRHVLAGPGIYLNYIEDSLEQIRRALEVSSSGAGVPGVSLYSYAATNVYSNEDYRSNEEARNKLPRQPWEYRPQLNSTFFTALSRTTSYTYTSGASVRTINTQPVFPKPAPVPPMPWKESPAAGQLSGSIHLAVGTSREDADGLVISLAGPEVRMLHSDGNGWFGAVDLQPGSYHATLTDRWGRVYEADVTIRAGAVAQLEFTLQPRAGAGRILLPLMAAGRGGGA
ncbi:MAG: hypothetical protein KatS3mg057_3160 [Herpetosiphonaceae bacterium]|nr:MAG: hypothetical protein KatS3mg057_3160 [Herpetosiphonaceae bacterium]